MATPTQDTDSFVQALQRFHDGLPPMQQRLLQTVLDRVTRTPVSGPAPEVQGYAAATGANWTNLTRWLNQVLTAGGPGRPGGANPTS